MVCVVEESGGKSDEDVVWSFLTDGHWSQSPRFAHFNEAKSVLRYCKGVTTSPSYVVCFERTGKCQAKPLVR